MVNEFLLGMALGASLTPIWYVLVEIANKFYQAFVVNNNEE